MNYRNDLHPWWRHISIDAAFSSSFLSINLTIIFVLDQRISRPYSTIKWTRKVCNHSEGFSIYLDTIIQGTNKCIIDKINNFVCSNSEHNVAKKIYTLYIIQESWDIYPRHPVVFTAVRNRGFEEGVYPVVYDLILANTGEAFNNPEFQ